MERLEHFLEQRQTRISKGFQESSLVISTTPIFLTQEIVDVQDFVLRDLLRNPPDQRPGGWNMQFNTEPTPSLNGLLLGDSRFRQLELFRNGHLELRAWHGVTMTERRDGLTYLAQRAITEYTVSMFRFAKEIYAHVNLSEPLILSLTLLNIKDAYLKRRPDSDPRFDRVFAWVDSELKVDPITVDSLEHPDQAAKRLLDRLWQAFGFDDAPLFDASGHWVP
jgi:hypothetical protein